MKVLFRLFAVFCASCAIVPSAQASFSIMPMEAHQKMMQDESRLTNEIEVYNSGNSPIHIASSIMDWKITADGEYEYAEAGTDPLSCAKWIQVSPAEFNVAPQKSVRVRYSITAPEKFNNERHAMIFFTSRPIPTKNSQGISMLIAMRMGCKIFVSPSQPLNKTGKITDMALQNASRSRVKVSVQNTAAVTFRAKGTIEVQSENGTVVAQGELKSAQVLPGASRNLWFDLPQPLPVGNYTLKAVIDHGVKQLLGGELKVKVVDQPLVVPESRTPETSLPIARETLPKSSSGNG